MFKKTLATALLVCSIPAMANAAWFLSTQVKNAGGTLFSSNNPAQVVTDGVLTQSYSTIVDQNPVATAGAGNSIRSFIITDSSAAGKSTITAPFTPVDGHTYSVAASFIVSKYSVTAGVQGGAGTVSPSSVGGIYYGYTLAKPLTFTFAPKAGYYIDGITGAPAEATVSALPAGVNKSVTVTLPAGYSFTGPLAISASTQNPTPALNHIMPQTVVVGGKVTLTASGSNLGGGTYNWSYISGPTNTRTLNTDASGKLSSATGSAYTVTPGPAIATFPASGASVTFYAPTTKGQYKFMVTNGTLSTVAVVNVLGSSSEAANQCQFCHTANGIAGSTATNNIGIQWAASVHSGSTTSSCAGCHYNAGTGSHPGDLTAGTVSKTNFKVTSPLGATVNNHGTPVTVAQGQVVCTGCHGTLHETATLTVACSSCHMGTTSSAGAFTPAAGGTDAHNVQPLAGCVDCHAVAQPNVSPLLVNDNNGVRAIMGDFAKTSHHIVNPSGVAVMNEQCAVCHMEGSVGQYGFGVDLAYHMKDNNVHLRNADTDADIQWNPENPDFGKLDNFCLSCHDNDGAKSTMVGKLQDLIIAKTGKAKDALNPFGDTISNGYDKMLRGRVVDAAGQFAPGNNSHHAVSGKRFTGRTRAALNNPVAFTQNSSATLPGVRETIYEAERFNSTYKTLATNNTPETDVPGTLNGRNGGSTLGDDSTLHCADCHTVGQFAARGSKAFQNMSTAFGGGITNFYKTAIGAHGSSNEYMLRNSIGTDQMHRGARYDYSTTNMSKGNPFAGVKADGTVSNLANQAVPATEVPSAAPMLVCYNCHVYSEYGSVYFSATSAGGRDGGHAEEHSRGSYCNGPYNTSGSGRATTYSAVYGSYSTQTAKLGTFQGVSNFNFGRLQPGTAATNLDGTANSTYTSTVLTAAGMNGSGNGGANIFQIQCMNCHNSGPANGFGGIHGSKVQTYTDALGTTQKVVRFLPGLGNTMYVPGVAVAGADDKNWELKNVAGTNAGCYTLGTNAASPNVNQLGADGQKLFGNWGSCTDHSAATTGTGTGYKPVKEFNRPVNY